MQPEVLNNNEIQVRREDLVMGVARVVLDNPKTMYDGTMVIRLDWMESLDDATIEEYDLLSAAEVKSDQKRTAKDDCDVKQKKIKN